MCFDCKETLIKSLFIITSRFYIERMAVSLGITMTRFVTASLSLAYTLVPHKRQATPNQIMADKQRLGSVIYLTITARPDIGYTVNILS